MFRIFIIGVLLLSFKSFFGQGKVESKPYDLMLKALLSHSVNEVNVKEVIGDTTIVFLDAREKREYEVSHIKTAKWVGYDDFKMKRVDAIPKNKKVVVYCSVGYRSEKIAEKLMESGYTEVSNLYGGIFEWKNQENPVYNKNGEMEKIHAYDKTWGIWLNKGEKVYK